MNLALSLFILSSIALWIFINSKGNWIVKALLISSVLYFFASVNNSMDSFSGWPTDDPLPEKFQVYWYHIDEPNLANNNPGKIYVWVIDIGERKEYSSFGCNGIFLNFEEDHQGEPRVHEIAYSVKMHERLEGVMPSLKKGITVLGGKPQRMDGDTGSNRSSEELSESDEFMLYDFPEVTIEPK